jgi:hypothetical protein
VEYWYAIFGGIDRRGRDAPCRKLRGHSVAADIGDLDGVVVVPVSKFEEVARRGLEQRDREVERERKLLQGASLQDVLRSG